MDRRKKIVNFSEGVTVIKLRKVAHEYGAQVFAKVRIADALDITQSGLSKAEYSYALRAHFDFVVADRNSVPYFGVEFDGPSHDQPGQKEKDKRKDNICKKLGMPLLHIDRELLHKKIADTDLVSWLAELWFLWMQFTKAQQAGSIPHDEIFDYSFIFQPTIETGRLVVTAPFDPFWESRNIPHLLEKAGKIRCGVPQIASKYNDDGYYTAVAAYQVTEGGWVVGQSRCRASNYPPVTTDEFCRDLAVANAVQKIDEFIRGALKPLLGTELNRYFQPYNYPRGR